MFIENNKSLSENKIISPWLEKYRPVRIKDVKSQPEITNILNNVVITKEMTNLLLHGSPGVGKTTAIWALCYELYGKHFDKYVLELNASDDRGIKSVHETIINFTKRNIFLNT